MEGAETLIAPTCFFTALPDAKQIYLGQRCCFQRRFLCLSLCIMLCFAPEMSQCLRMVRGNKQSQRLSSLFPASLDCPTAGPHWIYLALSQPSSFLSSLCIIPALSYESTSQISPPYQIPQSWDCSANTISPKFCVLQFWDLTTKVLCFVRTFFLYTLIFTT